MAKVVCPPLRDATLGCVINYLGSQGSNVSPRVISEQIKQCLVEVKVLVIEAKLGLLEVPLELVPSHTMKLHQPMLGITPERLDTVDMPGAFDKLVVAMIDSKVLFQAEVNQPIVASPAVSVDEAIRVHFAADDGLQRGFVSIRDDFGIDTIAWFEQTKDDVAYRIF